MSLLLKIIGAVLLARLATVEFVGWFQFIVTLFGVVSMTAVSGIEGSMTRAIAREEICNGKEVIRSRFFSSLVGVAIVVIVGIYYTVVDWSLGLSIVGLSTLVPALYVFDAWRSYWRGRGDFRRLVLGNIFLSGAQLLALFSALWFFNDSLFFVVLIYGGITALVHYVLWRSLERYLNGNNAREVLSYGLALTKAQIPLLISRYADKMLVFFIAGPAQLAYYAIGVDIARTIAVKVGEFVDLESPHIARRGVEVRRMIIVVFGSFLISIVLYTTLPFIVPFLFSHRYTSSIVIAQIMILFLPCTVMAYVYRNHFLLYLKHEKVLTTESWLFSFFRLILLVFFYYEWDVIGLVIAVGVQPILRVVLLYISSRYMS